MRYETAPGQQAQVDFGQRQVWIGQTSAVAHVFVFTLGYSRRMYPHAFPHERLDAVLDGHEAFHHFGGVPEHLVLDNAQPVVLRVAYARWRPVRFRKRLGLCQASEAVT